jgi:hypothetical protein
MRDHYNVGSKGGQALDDLRVAQVFTRCINQVDRVPGFQQWTANH